MNHLTLGVAGHVDHGKTALVRALTGMETDRLKEEQERGMSIVLGFAFLSFPYGMIDFIDVPGHERFVDTMISGAAGIDAALLVVAANESIMPQTREHVALLELLGVRRGIVVAAKGDLLKDPADRTIFTEEVNSYLKSSFLENSPLLWTSTVSGEGLEELTRALQIFLDEQPPLLEERPFYLPVDRVFSKTGYGTVVTGTLRHGFLAVGQRVEVAPSGIKAEVRGLQVHGHSVEQTLPGWRTAVNLRGLRPEDVPRGCALAAPESLVPTRLLDIELHLLPESNALKQGHKVKVLFGTGGVLGRVYPLGKEDIAPGETAPTQLRLEEEIQVPVYERLILRSLSPVLTLGGGTIVDSAPQRHRKGDRSAAALVQTLISGSLPEKAAAKLHEAQESGLETARLAQSLGVSLALLETALESLSVCQSDGFVLLMPDFEMLAQRMLALVRQFHTANPMQRGMPREALRRALPKRLVPPLFERLVDHLVEQKAMEAQDGFICERGFSIEDRLTPVERAIAQEIEKKYCSGGLKPPNFSDVIGADRRRKTLYYYLRESGKLIETTERTSNRAVTFHQTAIHEAKRALQHHLSPTEGASVSEINQWLQTTRKYAIPLLEYFDRQGVTQRIGDLRLLARPNSQEGGDDADDGRKN